MKRYFSVDEISNEIGISRQQLTIRIKNLGLDTKKLSEKEKQIIIEDCKDVLEGKDIQNSIFEINKKAKQVKSVTISNITGATTEQTYAITKQKFDYIVQCLNECEYIIKDTGMFVKSSNGTSTQNVVVKTFNDLMKSYNTTLKTLNDLEEKLKLTSTSIERAIDD